MRYPGAVAVALAVTFMVSGCVARTPDSGVHGTVTAGPFCPVQRIDQPCPDRPAQVHLEAIRFPSGFEGVPLPQSGHVIARFPSDANGGFRVALPPGRYLLYGDRNMTGFMMCQTTVTVPPHQWVQADVACDTGIR